jgi:hypothetical protein
MHDRSIKSRQDINHSQKSRAYIEEGRYRILELMGYLASFYRTHAKIQIDKKYQKQDLRPDER